MPNPSKRFTSLGTVNAGAALNITLASLPTVGDFIMVVVEGWNGSLDFITSAAADNQSGNTWARAGESALNGSNRAAVYYCQSVVGSSGTFTITITPTSDGGWYGEAAANVWNPQGNTIAFDLFTSNTGSSLTPSTGTLGTNSTAVSIEGAIFGTSSDQTSITVDSDTPTWDEEVEELTIATSNPGEGNSRVPTSAGTHDCSWTMVGNSTTWAAAIAAFSVTGSGGSVLQPGVGSLALAGRAPTLLEQMANDARIVIRKS